MQMCLLHHLIEHLALLDQKFTTPRKTLLKCAITKIYLKLDQKHFHSTSHQMRQKNCMHNTCQLLPLQFYTFYFQTFQSNSMQKAYLSHFVDFSILNLNVISGVRFCLFRYFMITYKYNCAYSLQKKLWQVSQVGGKLQKSVGRSKKVKGTSSGLAV